MHALTTTTHARLELFLSQPHSHGSKREHTPLSARAGKPSIRRQGMKITKKIVAACRRRVVKCALSLSFTFIFLSLLGLIPPLSLKKKKPQGCRASHRALVHLLDGRAGTAITARWWCTCSAAHVRHATTWHTSAATRGVHLLDDRIADTLEFLELVFELVLLGHLVTVKPADSLVDGLLDRLLVCRVNLVLHALFVDGVAHAVGVVLERVLRLHLFQMRLILLLVLLRLLDHALNVLLAEPP